MASRPRDDNSMATILTFDNRADADQWSMVWSTTQIPGMDNATGGGNRYRTTGRRRLRVGSLTLSALLTMHCRVTASALTGGFFIFMMFLVLAVIALANPLRHFEVYLGQWSINGPGRAFRIVPLFDGIGIAMCINAIVRAMICCTTAAIAMMYVIHSASDARLPFTYCRDFDFNQYDPELKEIKFLTWRAPGFSMETGDLDVEYRASTVGLIHRAWRNTTRRNRFYRKKKFKTTTAKVHVCKEKFPGPYPSLYATPHYNFFYVQVIGLQPDLNFSQIQLPLMVSLICVWCIVWLIMISERLSYGRIVWNNMSPSIVYIPWAWSLFFMIAAAANITFTKNFDQFLRVGAKEVVNGISDAFEVAMYIHSVSVGTELITGKGLNRFAAGHIDASLHGENVWHSVLVLILTAVHSGGAALCALVDPKQVNSTAAYDMHESTLWIIPMYSKCTSMGGYSHFVSTSVFFGLAFSYITVAFVLLKTALHTIFEYKVRLVFVEQVVVGVLVLSCALLSIVFTTGGGLPLMESVDAVMTGVAMPLICLLELLALLYVYRGHDFTSDVNVSMEENACASRISIQWQIIPWITLGTLITKISVISEAELPHLCMVLATIPIIFIFIAVPLRALYNVYSFLRPRVSNRDA